MYVCWTCYQWQITKTNNNNCKNFWWGFFDDAFSRLTFGRDVKTNNKLSSSLKCDQEEKKRSIQNQQVGADLLTEGWGCGNNKHSNNKQVSFFKTRSLHSNQRISLFQMHRICINLGHSRHVLFSYDFSSQ